MSDMQIIYDQIKNGSYNEIRGLLYKALKCNNVSNENITQLLQRLDNALPNGDEYKGESKSYTDNVVTKDLKMLKTDEHYKYLIESTPQEIKDIIFCVFCVFCESFISRSKENNQKPGRLGFTFDFNETNGRLKVIDVEENSPAAKQKLECGQLILRLDGKGVRNMTVQQVKDSMRGAVGITIELTIEAPEKPIYKKLIHKKLIFEDIKLPQNYHFIVITKANRLPSEIQYTSQPLKDNSTPISETCLEKLIRQASKIMIFEENSVEMDNQLAKLHDKDIAEINYGSENTNIMVIVSVKAKSSVIKQSSAMGILESVYRRYPREIHKVSILTSSRGTENFKKLI